MGEPRHFALVGGTFWGNRGAEAMVSTCIGRIRERFADARFTVFSYYPNRDTQLVHDPRIEVRDGRPPALACVHFPFALLWRLFHAVGLRLPDRVLPSPVRALRQCDAVCDVQGISFDDGRLLFLPFKILSVWPAILLDVPVIKFSQAMGPFQQTANRLAARWFLSRCCRVYARGRVTAGFLRDLNLPSIRWALAADLAFCFKPGDSLTSENEERVAAAEQRLCHARSEGRTIVAITPSSLVLQKQKAKGIDYARLLGDLAQHCVTHDRQVIVLPNATREGRGSARNNDLYAIERIAKWAAKGLSSEQQNRLTLVRWDVNTDGIRRLIGRSDVLITSRFHAMVAGLSLGVPTLVVGWSHKYTEVLADFQCESWAVDFQRANSSSGLISRVEDLIRDGESTRRRILAALPAVRASSASQFSFLDWV